MHSSAPRLLTGMVTLLLACAESPASQAETLSLFSPFPALDTKAWYVSDGWTNGPHQSCEWRPDALTGTDGNLRLTLSDNGGKVRPIGCAELHTNKLYGYGVYEARMQTAKGSGLNTAFFTYTGPPAAKEHDEIDFEFLGKDSGSVQLNYYTNGQGGHEHIIPLGFDASQGMHTYAFEWEPTQILWYVDGKKVYRTPEGAAIPKHPSNLFFSLWSGAPVSDGWLGHFTYVSPVTAEIASVRVTPQP